MNEPQEMLYKEQGKVQIRHLSASELCCTSAKNWTHRATLLQVPEVKCTSNLVVHMDVTHSLLQIHLKPRCKKESLPITALN